MGETNREWKYDAFISYRHLEPDAYVAGALHKLLESYKLPGNLIKANGDKLKRTKINKVFRDAEELPLTSNLNDTIIEALENSEYLIAICSPKFGESLWCKKEVDTFIEMRGLDHVLTVLVDGEPSESFPEVLLYRNVEVTRPDGTVEIVREPIEPLAANARGANNRERLKMLKNECLRLMAPMFGCSFDDLKQRHREQKMKRAMRNIGIVAAVCLAFGIVSTSMALRISNQNSQISKQNEQIAEQADKIAEQYKEVLVSNANAVGDNARNYLNNGDRVNAIEKALSVYPTDGQELPYIQKVEYVLSDSLNLYENGTRIKSDKLIAIDSIVSEVILSPKGKNLVACGKDYSVWICDAVKGKVINELVVEDDHISAETIEFVDDDNLFYVVDNIVYKYNISSNVSEQYLEIDTLFCHFLSYSADKQRLLVAGYDGLYLYDTENKKLVSEISVKDETADEEQVYSFVGYSRLAEFEPGSDDYFMAVFENSSADAVMIRVYDIMEGRMVGQENVNGCSIADARIYGNNLYLSLHRYKNGVSSIESSNFESIITAYEIKENAVEKLWEHIIDCSFVSRIAVAMNGMGEYIACADADSVTLLNRADGSKINLYQMGGYVVTLFGFSVSDSFVCITKDGAWNSIYPTYGDPMRTNIFECNSENIAIFELSGCVVTVPNNSNIITVYRSAFPPEYEEIETVDFGGREKLELSEEITASLKQLGVNETLIENAFLDKSNRFMGISYMNMMTEFFRIDANGVPVESCGKISSFNENMNYMEISEDGQYMILAGDMQAYLFRTNGVDYSTSFPDESMVVAYIPNFKGIDFSQQYVYVRSGEEMYKIPIHDSDKVGEMAQKTLDMTLE